MHIEQHVNPVYTLKKYQGVMSFLPLFEQRLRLKQRKNDLHREKLKTQMTSEKIQVK